MIERKMPGGEPGISLISFVAVSPRRTTSTNRAYFMPDRPYPQERRSAEAGTIIATNLKIDAPTLITLESATEWRRTRKAERPSNPSSCLTTETKSRPRDSLEGSTWASGYPGGLNTERSRKAQLVSQLPVFLWRASPRTRARRDRSDPQPLASEDRLRAIPEAARHRSAGDRHQREMTNVRLLPCHPRAGAASPQP